MDLSCRGLNYQMLFTRKAINYRHYSQSAVLIDRSKHQAFIKRDIFLEVVNKQLTRFHLCMEPRGMNYAEDKMFYRIKNYSWKTQINGVR